MTPTEQAIWRTERARVVGWLSRRFGDLALAEEATQDALELAARQLNLGTVIERPGAWLTTVANRQAIAMLRKRQPITVPLAAAGDPAIDIASSSALGDDLFTLLFTCCHPAIAREQQIALTLRHVCGLSTAQIASAFLVAEPTMAKRLVRARDKIKHAGIAFRSPDRTELHDRVDEVRTVIYLTFNEGWFSSDSSNVIQPELCDEAIWLARHLLDVAPDPETLGLLALMLIQDSRRRARTDDDGQLVEFARQDRTRWDETAIEEGRQLLTDAHDGTIGPYRIEAAIALLHVAGTQPDWPRIADLLVLLAKVNPSPVVALNHAIAVGMADGPNAGLALLGTLRDDPRLATSSGLHAARAEFLQQTSNPAEARSAWQEAVRLAPNEAQRAALKRRFRFGDLERQVCHRRCGNP